MATAPLSSQVYIPAAPTAATASLPTMPIHAMSVRLYAVCTMEVAMIGHRQLGQRSQNISM